MQVVCRWDSPQHVADAADDKGIAHGGPHPVQGHPPKDGTHHPCCNSDCPKLEVCPFRIQCEHLGPSLGSPICICPQHTCTTSLVCNSSRKHQHQHQEQQQQQRQIACAAATDSMWDVEQAWQIRLASYIRAWGMLGAQDTRANAPFRG